MVLNFNKILNTFCLNYPPISPFELINDFSLGSYLHICGGAIISKWQFLTAAHCFDKKKKKEKWLALVGSANSSVLHYGSSLLKDNSLNVHKVT